MKKETKNKPMSMASPVYSNDVGKQSRLPHSRAYVKPSVR